MSEMLKMALVLPFTQDSLETVLFDGVCKAESCLFECKVASMGAAWSISQCADRSHTSTCFNITPLSSQAG